MGIQKNMNVKRLSQFCLMALLGVFLVSCSKSENSTPPATGFLPNYSLLKPIRSPEGSQIYIYKNPSVQRSDYKAVLVKPVVLYQTAVQHGVTAKEIQTARNELNDGITDIVSQSSSVVSKPGSGVASLSVAITGATTDGSGFSPLNLIPISAAIKLASMATDLDSKIPVLIVELKLTDSVSGELLLESVSVVSGDTFRNRANTAKEFAQLANVWIQQGLQYSLNQR